MDNKSRVWALPVDDEEIVKLTFSREPNLEHMESLIEYLELIKRRVLKPTSEGDGNNPTPLQVSDEFTDPSSALYQESHTFD